MGTMFYPTELPSQSWNCFHKFNRLGIKTKIYFEISVQTSKYDPFGLTVRLSAACSSLDVLSIPPKAAKSWAEPGEQHLPAASHWPKPEPELL